MQPRPALPYIVPMTEPQAPAITLKAVVSGRRVTFNEVTVPTLLLLFDQGTSTTLDPVLTPVRERWPEASQVQIANVVDGRKFPRIIRKVAETLMNNSYHTNAKELPAGHDPADYLLILPDWDASVMKALAIEDVSKQLALAVVAPGGELMGTYQGDEAPAQAIALLERAIGV